MSLTIDSGREDRVNYLARAYMSAWKHPERLPGLADFLRSDGVVEKHECLFHTLIAPENKQLYWDEVNHFKELVGGVVTFVKTIPEEDSRSGYPVRLYNFWIEASEFPQLYQDLCKAHGFDMTKKRRKRKGQ